MTNRRKLSPAITGKSSSSSIGVLVEMSHTPKTYVVEHLDPELGPWSSLEYQAIAEESRANGAAFCLSSVPRSLTLPTSLRDAPGLAIEYRSVEEIYANDKGRVCLLDPAAKAELSADDATKFDVFLFGGILGTNRSANSVNKADRSET